jgi:hypothetical protein
MREYTQILSEVFHSAPFRGRWMAGVLASSLLLGVVFVQTGMAVSHAPNAKPPRLEPVKIDTSRFSIEGEKPAESKTASTTSPPSAESSAPAAAPSASAPQDLKLPEMALAVEIIRAAKAPFAPKLTAPEAAAGNPDEQQNQNAQPQAQPESLLTTIRLKAILFSSRQTTALLSIDDKLTQLVQKGEVIHLPGGDVRVNSIGKETVDLEELSGRKEKRLLTIAEITTYETMKGSGLTEADIASGEPSPESRPVRQPWTSSRGASPPNSALNELQEP